MIVIESFLSSWLHRPAVAGFITAAANFNLAGVCFNGFLLKMRDIDAKNDDRSPERAVKSGM